MPVENMEEEGLAKNPDLLIAQWKFQLESVPTYKVDKNLVFGNIFFNVLLFYILEWQCSQGETYGNYQRKQNEPLLWNSLQGRLLQTLLLSVKIRKYLYEFLGSPLVSGCQPSEGDERGQQKNTCRAGGEDQGCWRWWHTWQYNWV